MPKPGPSHTNCPNMLLCSDVLRWWPATLSGSKCSTSLTRTSNARSCTRETTNGMDLYMLWYSIALCAIGAATQGWDQTGSNGANLSFPRAFNIDGTIDGTTPKPPAEATHRRMDCRCNKCDHLLDRRSDVSAYVQYPISLDIATKINLLGNSGAFIVDPLNKYFARRGEIFITACCLTATPIGSAFAQSWQRTVRGAVCHGHRYRCQERHGAHLFR